MDHDAGDQRVHLGPGVTDRRRPRGAQAGRQRLQQCGADRVVVRRQDAVADVAGAETTSARLGTSVATIDLAVPSLRDADVLRAETLANDVVVYATDDDENVVVLSGDVHYAYTSTAASRLPSAPPVTPALADSLGPAAAMARAKEMADAIKAETYTTLPSGKVMVCELTLRNGFTVRGEAAVVSKANFNEEVGRKISRENARNKVWELEGYLLQQRLYDDLVEAQASELA